MPSSHSHSATSPVITIEQCDKKITYFFHAKEVATNAALRAYNEREMNLWLDRRILLMREKR